MPLTKCCQLQGTSPIDPLPPGALSLDPTGALLQTPYRIALNALAMLALREICS